MTNHCKFLILGAGPAGLSFANRLLQRGEADFTVLEQEEAAGGLCRSVNVDGSPLDIGGGHFLDVRTPAVVDFIFGFMPQEEWGLYERISKIAIHGQLIGSPIESHIWELDEKLQERYLRAIAKAGCNTGVEQPAKFVDWINWKLGKSIADDYMLPYNRKMFGQNLDQLGTYWLDKLPNVSYEETVKSCREKRFCGTQPGHARFYYPRHHGYGEVWRRMAERLGDRLKLGTAAKTLDYGAKTVNGIFSGDVIVSTIPWASLERIDGVSDDGLKAIKRLRWSSVDIDYVPENMATDAHWVYYPDEALSYHRILVRHNFCRDSKGVWTETNAERSQPLEIGRSRHSNLYAYPLNTLGKNEAMKALLAELSANGVFALGRWGEWQHYNSDVVVARACALADSFLGGR